MISYVFTYRQSTVDRYNNLLTVLGWLAELSKSLTFEVVIVEQDEASKLTLSQNYPFPIKHIFAYNPKLFNRSWGFNIAIQNTDSQILFFGDSDMVVDPLAITHTVGLLNSDQFDAVSPFQLCIELSPEETAGLNLQSFTYDLIKVPRGGMNFCSGIVAFTRLGIQKIYNWDERFEGWGGEDDIQFMKTRQLLRHSMLTNNCYHMYHQRSKLDGTNQHENYQNNLRLFWQYQRNQQSIIFDMKNAPSNGNLNKYRQ